MDGSAGWWKAFSDYYRFTDDMAVTFDITGSTEGTDNWNAPDVVLTTDADRQATDDGYKEYVVLRADNYGWGDNYASYTTMSRSSVDWTEWMKIAKSYTGTIAVQRKGDTFSIEETYTSTEDSSLTHVQKYTVTNVTADSVRFFICPDKATVNISKITVSTVDTMALKEAIDKAGNVYAADYSDEANEEIVSALATANAALESDNQDVIDAAKTSLTKALASVNTTTSLEKNLVGSYDFNGNITDAVSGKDATPVVIKNATVTTSASEKLSYDNGGIELGSYGLELPTKFNKMNNYTIAMNVSLGSSAIGTVDKSIYSIQKPGAWSVSREMLLPGWKAEGNGFRILSEVNSASTTWNWAGISNDALTADKTYNVIVRKEDNKTNIYLDGKLVASATNAKTGSFGQEVPVLLGANSWSLADMTVYDCEIYDRTLSSAEIASLNKVTAEENYVNYVRNTENCDNFYDISSYRDTTYTAPTKSDKIFAGWYTDADYTTPVSSSAISGYAYAKFADEDLLTTKCQARAGATAESESTDLRMMLAVDGLDYTNVGFDVTYNGKTYNGQSKIVYETIEGTDNGTNFTYTPSKFFGNSAIYMLSCILTDIPNANFGETIAITPYWTTLDGTKVTGATRNVTITEAFQKYN